MHHRPFTPFESLWLPENLPSSFVLALIKGKDAAATLDAGAAHHALTGFSEQLP